MCPSHSRVTNQLPLNVNVVDTVYTHVRNWRSNSGEMLNYTIQFTTKTTLLKLLLLQIRHRSLFLSVGLD